MNLSGCFTMPWMTSRCVVGIDVGHAGVMALEEQAVRRDDAELVLQRRHAPVGPVLPVDEHVGAPAADVRLELRWHAVRRGLDDAAHFEVRLRDFQPLRPSSSDPGRRRDGRAGQGHAAPQEPASCLRLRGTRIYDVVSCRHAARPWASRHVRLLHDGVLPASHGAVYNGVRAQCGLVATARKTTGSTRRDVVLASVSIVKPKAGNQKPPNNLAYDAREQDYYRPDHLAKRGERLLAQPMFK